MERPDSWSVGAGGPERRSFTTHVVDIGDDQVVKRFRSWGRGEHLREWQALTLLASYAPDLAPTPLSADLTSIPPHLRMSRVAGWPLDGQAVTPGHLDAVASAINRLVDFEDSGRSDRAYELAAFAEHPSVWHDTGVETGPLLGRFELTEAERRRVLFFRRGLAFFWLLIFGQRDDHQDTLHRQAARLLALLNS